MHSIYQHRLENGMTVLVCPVRQVPKVCTQLWYRVGSADERDGKRGIAHLLEHMLFKGTSRLSEVDVSAIVHLLSGYTNAFTSYDYTGYIFSLPKYQWQVSLDIFADCMTNCRFDSEQLNSEMRAVVQELRLYEDEFEVAASERLFSQMFSGHPYQYPIVGYKRDLRLITPDDLRCFYRTFYRPNNAILVVVGDVRVREVVDLAEQFFASKQAKVIDRVMPHWQPPLRQSGVTMYREVSQAVATLHWIVPGLCAMRDTTAQCICYLLATGKQSLLYQTLVINRQLATYVGAEVQAMRDFSVLLITIVSETPDRLRQAVAIATEYIQEYSLKQSALERAIRSVAVSWSTNMETLEEIAYEIGQQFLSRARVDVSIPMPSQDLTNQIHSLLAQLRVTRVSIAWVLPIQERNEPLLYQLQLQASQDDERFLATRIRTQTIEMPRYAKQLRTIWPKRPIDPVTTEWVGSNGLRTLYIERPNSGKVELLLWLPANYMYDPPALFGLAAITERLLDQGTTQYPGQLFTQQLEQYGMQLSINAGQIRLVLLSEHIEIACTLLGQLVTTASLTQEALERVKVEQRAQIVERDDTPYAQIEQVARGLLFADHPHAYSPIGTVAGITAVSRKQVVEYYRSFMSPQGALLAVVGDVTLNKVKQYIDVCLTAWTGPSIPPIAPLPLGCRTTSDLHIRRQRDQTTIALVAQSISLFDKRYGAVELLDYILLGGRTGSMFSRLFQLREQTGLFYTVGGSLAVQAGFQPEYMIIKTLVSPESVSEVVRLLKEVLVEMQQLTAQELEQAQRALLVHMSDQLETSYGIAQYVIRAQRYFGTNQWANHYIRAIEGITLAQLKSIAKLLLDPKRFTTITIGRS